MPHLGLLNKILDFTLHLPVGLNFLDMSSMEIRDVVEYISDCLLCQQVVSSPFSAFLLIPLFPL